MRLPAVPERFRHLPFGFLGFLLAVVVFKLWLVSGQTVQAIPAAGHDDFLFIDNAQNLAAGRWLGFYTNTRLIKGAGYPLWLAVNSWFHAPVLLTQHILYLLACGAVTAALAHHVERRWLRAGIFLVLALNPATCTQQLTRTMREGIYPALTLLVAACIIGSVGPNLKRGWLIGLGLSLAWFRHTREEWNWMLPLIAIATPIFLLRVIPLPKTERRHRLAWGLAPVAIVVAAALAIGSLNQIRYGFFGNTEFTDGSLPRALSALYRISPATWHPYVAVPRETRARLYEVSPAFAELRFYFDGEGAVPWVSASATAGLPGLPEGEMAYGWFQWAIRDAVHAAGYDTAPKAQAYYTRLAGEIETACADGRLKSTTRQFSTLPPWHGELRQPLAAAFRKGLADTARFADMSFESQPSQQPDLTDRLALIARVTHSPLAPAAPPGTIPPTNAADPRVKTMTGIHAAYALLVPFLLGAAALIWVLRLMYYVRERQLTAIWVIAGGVALATVTRILLLAFLHVSAFWTLDPLYLSAAYPMALLFAGLTLADLGHE